MGPLTTEGFSAVSQTEFFYLLWEAEKWLIPWLLPATALVLAASEMNEHFTLQQYHLRLLAKPRSQLCFWGAHYAVMFFLVTITIFTLSSFFFFF